MRKKGPFVAKKGPLLGSKEGYVAQLLPSGSATALESWQVWKELPVYEIPE